MIQNSRTRLLTALAAGLLASSAAPGADPRPPNFIVIFCDDLGYGDLGVYGHPTIRTPNIDRMAAEGLRFTDFYVAAEVCTPSRAALLTGRLPIRSGMASDSRRVLFPDSAGGLPKEEVTVAEALKERGYQTAAIGKWHLGLLTSHPPREHGFDHYFGLPYSNDMDLQKDAPRGAAMSLDPKIEWWNVPLVENDRVIEQPADQTQLTRRYTEEAIKFVQANRQKPFFLYLPHSMPHVPLFRSSRFAGHSARGLYGDVIEELDWSVGQILEAVRELGLAEQTLVFFTSDNGPWLTQGLAGGSAGLLKGGKGSTWEGGMRVPAIAWWPGRIKPGRLSSGIVSSLDLMPTLLALAGGRMPADREIDGVEQTALLLGTGPSQRETMFYYRGAQIFAVRHQGYKLHFKTQAGYGQPTPEIHEPPLLFHLPSDPAERFDVARDHPEIISQILKLVTAHQAKLVPGKPQLDERIAR